MAMDNGMLLPLYDTAHLCAYWFDMHKHSGALVRVKRVCICVHRPPCLWKNTNRLQASFLAMCSPKHLLTLRTGTVAHLPRYHSFGQVLLQALVLRAFRRGRLQPEAFQLFGQAWAEARSSGIPSLRSNSLRDMNKSLGGPKPAQHVLTQEFHMLNRFFVLSACSEDPPA